MSNNIFDVLSDDTDASVVSIKPVSKVKGIVANYNGHTATKTDTKPVVVVKKRVGAGGVKVIRSEDVENASPHQLSAYEAALQEKQKQEADKQRQIKELKARECHYFTTCKQYKDGEHGPYCEDCWFDKKSPNVCVSRNCGRPCSLCWERPGTFYRSCYRCRYPDSLFPELK
jgi:hypothetical protein